MGIYEDTLRDEGLPYAVWGAGQIDDEARKQMDRAMQLPVSLAGALMPDAHVGYGLPIGGVLAVEDAVIPYAVGVDIACRVRCSFYEVSPILVKQQPGRFKNALNEQTRFGAGAKWATNERVDHAVLDDAAWDDTRFVGSLKDTAFAQLGTSGSGNHFVNWCAFELEKDDAQLGMKAGSYLALLSHSGSRGVGFKIAKHYSELAMGYHPNLDKAVRFMAWLPMAWEAGQEYWRAMELAGRFAEANHEVIHRRVAKAVGLKPIAAIENHHNFAWKEAVLTPDGEKREAVVHRKGATPAGDGVLGVIPGTMADWAYVVRGRGVAESLNSASHGAGRQMSRTKALENITKTELTRYLKAKNVTLLGAGMDESPQAYKPIEAVMAAQANLVKVIGRMMPIMVRMDGTGSKAED